MKENVTASDYMRLIQQLYRSCFHIDGRNPKEIQDDIDAVLALLASDGLDFKRARTHQNDLREVRDWIERKRGSPEVFCEICAEVVEKLANAGRTVFASLIGEGNERLLVTLDGPPISDKGHS